MMFFNFPKYVVQAPAPGFGGTDGGDVGGTAGGAGTSKPESNDNTCKGQSAGLVWDKTQNKCVQCKKDSQCPKGQRCKLVNDSYICQEAPAASSANTKKPPAKKTIDYRAWFEPNNVEDGLVDAGGLENQLPFNEWNYAIYEVNQNTLIPNKTLFPAGTNPLVLTDTGTAGGEAYYWKPGALKKATGKALDTPTLSPDEIYYMVMRVYNTGEKSWESKAHGLTFTHKSSIETVDKNMRSTCKATIGSTSICSAAGSVLTLQGKKPSTGTTSMTNKWFNIDLNDGDTWAKFDPANGQKIRSSLKNKIIRLKETKTATLLRQLETNCAKGTVYSSGQYKQFAKEIYQADNFFEFLYVVFGWDGGKCNTYKEDIARPRWLRCKYPDEREHCSLIGKDYVDGFCSSKKLLTSKWVADPGTTKYATEDIRTPGIFNKMWKGAGGEKFYRGFAKLYEFLINGEGKTKKTPSDITPRCQHKGFGKVAPPNMLPEPLGYPTPPNLNVLNTTGAKKGTMPKSPMVTLGRCKLKTILKTDAKQPDEFYNHAMHKLFCKEPPNIHSANKNTLKMQIVSKGTKINSTVWGDMAPEWDAAKIDKGDVAYFGFYFRTPGPNSPLLSYTMGAKGKQLPPQWKLKWDLVVPSTVKHGPTTFSYWQNATEGKIDPDHTNRELVFYVSKTKLSAEHFGTGVKTPSVYKASTKPLKQLQQAGTPTNKKLTQTVQEVVDEDLTQILWYTHGMDKFQSAPYDNGTYFFNDHYIGPAEDGFITKGSIGTTTDKFRKYTNSIWQIARPPSNKLNSERGITGGSYGISEQSKKLPKVVFNYDYQIRKAIMPESTVKEAFAANPNAAPSEKLQAAAHHALRLAKNQSLNRVRGSLYYWIRTVGKGLGADGISLRFPQLVDTGLTDEKIPPATNEDLEELLKIETISRKMMPHGLKQAEVGGKKILNITGYPIKIYCQNPFNTGVYSPAQKCNSYSTIRPPDRNPYKPNEKNCDDKNPCTRAGFKCENKVCEFDTSTDKGKLAILNDYIVQIAGIAPGYDLDNVEVAADSYRAPDWNYSGDSWAYRQVQPGPVSVTLRSGDFLDRATWGHSPSQKNWKPTGKWIMPKKNGADLNPIKNSDIMNEAAKRIENSVSLNDRPTLELSEPPIADTLQEIVDSMANGDNWFYDYNFMYKPWQKNTQNIQKFQQEMEVTFVKNYVGKCVVDKKIYDFNEKALSFAYESNAPNSKAQTDPQKKMAGRFVGITSKEFGSEETYKTTKCTATSYDTSIVSIHPNTLDKIYTENKAGIKAFNEHNPIYNKITFDIMNERLDKVSSKTSCNAKSPCPRAGFKCLNQVCVEVRKYMFNSLEEEDRKALFSYVVSLDHNENKNVANIKSLIIEREGNILHGARPYFHKVRQIPIGLSSNLEDVQAGIIDLDVIPGTANALNKKLSNVSAILNDQIKKEQQKIGAKSNAANVWKFENKKLSKKYFRNYEDVVRGGLARYETIAYKVVKSYTGTRRKIGDTYEQKADQVFYIYPHFKNPNSDLNRKINLIDTQIKMGSEYTYDLYAVVLVYGTKYKYNNIDLIKQEREIDVAEDKETLEDYRDYPTKFAGKDKDPKMPFKAELAKSSQKVLIGPHPQGPNILSQNTAGEFKPQGAQIPSAASEEDWYGAPGTGKPQLEHKLKFINSYSISGYVDSRPSLGIFEIPLLRGPRSTSPAKSTSTLLREVHKFR